MQENEFDKQVKAAMDEFRLRPSEPVWPVIYEEIRDRKRRRTLLLLPILIGLMALGYFTWNGVYKSSKKHSSQKGPDTNISTTTKEKKINNGQTSSPDAVVSAKESPLEKPSTSSFEKENSDSRNDSSDKDTFPETGVISARDIRRELTKTNNRDVYHRPAGSKHTIISQKNSDLSFTFRPSSEKDILTEVNKKSIDVNSINESQNKIRLDNTPVITEPYSSLLTTNNIKDSKFVIEALPKMPATINNRKIKWGVDLAFGGSSRADQPLKGGSAEKSGALTADYLGPFGSGGNVAGGLLVLPPSDVKPGIGFKIGVAADKSVSRRLRVSASLRYSYLSEHITIGKSINPTASRVVLQGLSYSTYAVAQTAYAGMQTQDFTNKYHFIELPVSGHFTITPKWRTPLVWDAGVLLSRLISSNALLYDKAWGGVYYKGRNNLSKTQFGISTGFSVRFKGNNQWLWSIGPHISMNTTKLFQSTSDKNKHIVYGSMNLQLLLPGKKK